MNQLMMETKKICVNVKLWDGFFNQDFFLVHPCLVKKYLVLCTHIWALNKIRTNRKYKLQKLFPRHSLKVFYRNLVGLKKVVALSKESDFWD